LNKRKNQPEKFKTQKSKCNDADWWDEISEVEKASILRGLEDIKAGRVVPHEKVKKMYQKWLNK
jgi:hypothetical protein